MGAFTGRPRPAFPLTDYLKPRAEEERRLAAEEKKKRDEQKRIERELAEGAHAFASPRFVPSPAGFSETAAASYGAASGEERLPSPFPLAPGPSSAEWGWGGEGEPLLGAGANLPLVRLSLWTLEVDCLSLRGHATRARLHPP